MTLRERFDKYCNQKACTCWFDSLFKKDWSSCCKEHDLDIEYRRTQSSFEADVKLFKCVWKVCKPMAVVMFIGVVPMSWVAWKYYKNG